MCQFQASTDRGVLVSSPYHCKIDAILRVGNKIRNWLDVQMVSNSFQTFQESGIFICVCD